MSRFFSISENLTSLARTRATMIMFVYPIRLTDTSAHAISHNGLSDLCADRNTYTVFGIFAFPHIHREDWSYRVLTFAVQKTKISVFLDRHRVFHKISPNKKKKPETDKSEGYRAKSFLGAVTAAY